ncbi:MAG: carboxypeptidase-like regulatory domain-containing protein [Candidatus Cyclobacteriaceae bacterium M3_2C_046]
MRSCTKNIWILILPLLLLLPVTQLFGQGENRVIQFSGVVIGSDSTTGVPGVHIYVPKAGRGTTSNQYGYFSMPVLVYDSVVISAVGYQKQHYIIPDNHGDNFTAIIELMEDTTYLPEVEILPYPTEALFKEAILAMKLPEQDQNMRKNLDEATLARMFKAMPMNGSMNFRNYMQQQQELRETRYGPRSNPLLNPFAWGEFIRSIKRGDFKKK